MGQEGFVCDGGGHGGEGKRGGNGVWRRFRVSGLEEGVAVVVVDGGQEVFLLVGAPDQRLGPASMADELAPPGGCPERGRRQNRRGKKVEARPRDWPTLQIPTGIVLTLPFCVSLNKDPVGSSY